MNALNISLSRIEPQWRYRNLWRRIMKKAQIILGFTLAILAFSATTQSGLIVGQEKTSPNSRLAVVWTSGDPDVAHQVCFMYTENAKK
jgi:hypothetical protein